MYLSVRPQPGLRPQAWKPRRIVALRACCLFPRSLCAAVSPVYLSCVEIGFLLSPSFLVRVFPVFPVSKREQARTSSPAVNGKIFKAPYI